VYSGYIHFLIDWKLEDLIDEGFKRVTHSADVAKREGREIFSSNAVFLSYSDDMNLIRYVYDLERCPIGEPNRHFTRFSDFNTLTFRNQCIDCIASSSRVECLVVCFDDSIDPLTAHTYLHALTQFLSDNFKISKDIISHHIDQFFSLIFINQPLNLGLLANIDRRHIEEFHSQYCDGLNHCADIGVCPGACHHCLHFPFYSCPQPEEMENLNWKLLGDVSQW